MKTILVVAILAVMLTMPMAFTYDQWIEKLCIQNYRIDAVLTEIYTHDVGSNVVASQNYQIPPQVELQTLLPATVEAIVRLLPTQITSSY